MYGCDCFIWIIGLFLRSASSTGTNLSPLTLLSFNIFYGLDSFDYLAAFVVRVYDRKCIGKIKYNQTKASNKAK